MNAKNLYALLLLIYAYKSPLFTLALHTHASGQPRAHACSKGVREVQNEEILIRALKRLLGDSLFVRVAVLCYLCCCNCLMKIIDYFIPWNVLMQSYVNKL